MAARFAIATALYIFYGQSYEQALVHGAVAPHPAEERDRFAETIPVLWLRRHRGSDNVIGVGIASNEAIRSLRNTTRQVWLTVG